MLALFYTIEDEFHEIISSNVYSDVRYMGSHNQVSGGYLYTYKWDNSGKKNFTLQSQFICKQTHNICCIPTVMIDGKEYGYDACPMSKTGWTIVWEYIL